MGAGERASNQSELGESYSDLTPRSPDLLRAPLPSPSPSSRSLVEGRSAPLERSSQQLRSTRGRH